MRVGRVASNLGATFEFESGYVGREGCIISKYGSHLQKCSYIDSMLKQ